MHFLFNNTSLYRSSHQRCSMKKGVLRNFTKFPGKHLCQSLFFNKVAGLRPATLLKRRLWYRCFPVNFVKFLRTRFLQNTSGPLLLFIFIDLLLQQHFHFTSFAFLCSLLSTRNKIHFWLQSNKFFNCNDSGFIFRIFPITNLFELS